MEGERVLSGLAFVGEELELIPAEIVVRSGRIVSVDEVPHAPGRWICPAFFNAHTHVGDTVAMDIRCSGSLRELVAPPDGLKHRILGSTDRRLLVEGMRATIGCMRSTGTAGFADFREGGREGVEALREAVSGSGCWAVILGREGGEEVSHGIGFSSVRDAPGALQRAGELQASGRIVAVHAGESDASDIDGALALSPDLVVHMTHAEDRHLRQCADLGIPIAVCPRSNWLLGVTDSAAHPPLRRMLELGCRLLLGTDNAMFVQPDLFSELAFVATVYRLEARQLLKSAIEGSAVFGKPHFLEPGNEANLFWIDPMRSNIRFTRDIYATFVKRVKGCDIVENLLSAGCK